MTSLVAEKDLLEALGAAAKQVSAQAHAPYSQFHVGAALLTRDGVHYSGCNVESASYGLTQCAERNALGTAIAAGVKPGDVTAMLVYLPGSQPLPPCGACRQVMMELMDPSGLVVSFCDSTDTRSWSVAELMPEAFTGAP